MVTFSATPNSFMIDPDVPGAVAEETDDAALLSRIVKASSTRAAFTAEDLDRYPRPLDSDLEACRKAGVDLVFTPSGGGMWNDHHSLNPKPMIVEYSTDVVATEQTTWTGVRSMFN